MEKEVGDWMNFMIFSTTLCGNYNYWVNNPSISEIINVNTNPMCINLRKSYPDVEDKVIQSITLGFLYNAYNTISQYNKSENHSDDLDNSDNNLDDSNNNLDDSNNNLDDSNNNLDDCDDNLSID
jgi:hypothetical protein